MSKSAYEIRTDVLEMAKDYMDKQYNLNLEITQKLIEEGKKTLDDLPKLYSAEELMEKAKEFYGFVEKK